MHRILVAANVMAMIFGTDNLQPPSLVNVAAARMSQQIVSTGQSVKITKMARQRRDPCSRMNDVKARYFKYACMKGWASAHGYLRPKRAFSAFITPATGDGELWSYGFASGICDKSYAFTMTTFAKVNARGEDRTEFSVITAMHEWAHLFGAKHDNSNANIEHENALALVGPTRVLRFNPLALTQIMRCAM